MHNGALAATGKFRCSECAHLLSLDGCETAGETPAPAG